MAPSDPSTSAILLAIIFLAGVGILLYWAFSSKQKPPAPPFCREKRNDKHEKNQLFGKPTHDWSDSPKDYKR